jgi:hypothetical protein
MVALLPVASPARAQSQDPVTVLARQKFIEGVTAYDAARFDQARAAFLQAYALKRHPLVLLNLGQSELRAGYPVDGGNHLQQFLRDHKTATSAQKSSARAGIADAQKRAGFVILIVDTDGSQIAIDGRAVGMSPLLDPVFVKAGKHQASASHSGRSVISNFAARRGTATPVTLNFRAGAPPPPSPTAPSAPAWGPTPTPPATVPPPMGPLAPQPAGMPPQSMPRSGREAPIPWFKRKPIAWATVGATGLGVIGTLGFGIAAANASSAAGDVQTQILNEVQQQKNLPPEYIDKETRAPQPCGTRDGAHAPHPHYKDACQLLTDNLDSYDTDIALIGVSIALAIVGAGGTVAYYLVDTDKNKAAANKPSTPHIVGIAPFVSADKKGLGLVGRF